MQQYAVVGQFFCYSWLLDWFLCFTNTWVGQTWGRFTRSQGKNNPRNCVDVTFSPIHSSLEKKSPHIKTGGALEHVLFSISY